MDFVNLNGDVIDNVKLRGVNGRIGLYEGGNFTSPNDFFYLRVNFF